MGDECVRELKLELGCEHVVNIPVKPPQGAVPALDGRAWTRPGTHEVHAAEQRLLFEKRSLTTGAFHEGHTTAGG